MTRYSRETPLDGNGYRHQQQARQKLPRLSPSKSSTFIETKQSYIQQNAENQLKDAHLSDNNYALAAYQQQHQARQSRQLPSAPVVTQSAVSRSKLSRTTAKKKLTTLRLSNLALLLLTTVLISTAFFSSNWLEAEKRYYGSKFSRLGLWRFCFNSFSAKDDIVFKKFYVGCRWILADDYKPIRSFLLPSFFIATQLFYTAGFLLLVLICAGIVAVQQCFIIEREDHALRVLSIASLVSSASCSLAVIIFAINANGEDWMPDPQHNYFSWSFASALIGSLFLWIVALLFFIEMKLVIRKNLRPRT